MFAEAALKRPARADPGRARVARDTSTRAYVSVISIILAVSISTSPEVCFDVCLGSRGDQRAFNIPYLLFKFRAHAIDFVTLRLYDRTRLRDSGRRARASSDSYPHRIRSVSPISVVDTSPGNIRSRACRLTVSHGNKNPAW